MSDFEKMEALARHSERCTLDLGKLLAAIDPSYVVQPGPYDPISPGSLSLEDAVERAGYRSITDFGDTFVATDFIEQLAELGFAVVPIASEEHAAPVNGVPLGDQGYNKDPGPAPRFDLSKGAHGEYGVPGGIGRLGLKAAPDA